MYYILDDNQNTNVPMVIPTVYSDELGSADAPTKIDPYKYYVFGSGDSIPQLYLDFDTTTPNDGDAVKQYMFEFKSGRPATTLSLAADVEWLNSAQSISEGKIYQCSILNNKLAMGYESFTLPPIYTFNVTTDVAASLSNQTSSKTYSVADDLGNSRAFYIYGSSSYKWTVSTTTTSALCTWTIGSKTYTYSTVYRLNLLGAGNTTKYYVRFPVVGPCNITLVASTGTTGVTFYISNGSSVIKSGFCTMGTTNKATVDTYQYTGAAATLYIYASNAAYIHQIYIEGITTY